MKSNFGQKYPREMKQIKQCNILIVGNTGVGKTTLISALLQVPINNSVTQTISKESYTKPEFSIAVYDTPGLEKDKKQRAKVKQEIDKFLKQKNQKEPKEQIHAVWYCVNSQVTRKSEIDHKWIVSLAKKVPVIAVITRASGIEEEWLQPHLETVPDIRRVVPVMAKPETNYLGVMKSRGLESLLTATEDFLSEMAQNAILNAINAQANSAFGWCRDGSFKVLTAQLTFQFLPIPYMQSIAKKSATSGLQLWMLADISKTFGYKFDESTLKELCTVGVGLVGGFDSFIEALLKNLPGIDYNNIQTVQDVLNHLKLMLKNTVGELPFKEQLGEMLTGLANSNLVSGLPILSCLTAIVTTLATGILAVAYIEAMKQYKKAEYEEGKPMSESELKEVLITQIQQFMQLIRQSLGQGWSPGFNN